MPSVIGDLAVNVTTSTASLEVGMARAADIVSQSAKRMSDSFNEFNGRIDAVGGALKALTGIVSVGYGVHLFVGMIEGAIDAQAHLQDLADKAGTTASSLSALIPAAKLSGTSMDDVAAASAKFSKQLVDIQTGTGKAAQAFQALGFNSRDAARFLQDPVQGLFELSKRANEFANDGNKVAAVQLVMGKGAADLAKFMKQLSEQQTLTNRVTDEQAQAAKRLQDEYVTLQLRSDDLKNAIAAGLVPELSRLLQLFTDSTGGPKSLGAEIKALAADGSLAIWAHEAAIAVAVFAESLIAVGSAALAFKSSVDTVIADLKLVSAAANNPDFKLTGALGFSEQEAESARKEFAQALSERNSTLAEANDRYNALIKGSFTAFSDSLKQQLAALQAQRTAIRAGTLGDLADIPGSSGPVVAPRPSVNTTGVTGGVTKVDEFAKAIQNLAKQGDLARASIAAIFSGEVLTDAEKFLVTLKTSDPWKTFTSGQKAAIEAFVKIDAALQRQQAGLEAAAKAGDAFGKQLDSMADALGNQQAQLSAELTQLQLYGQATKEQSSATLEFQLSQGKLGEAMAVLQNVFPEVAAALTAYLRALASGVDATRNAVEFEKQFIAAQHDAIKSYGDATKALEDQLKSLQDQNFELANGTEALNRLHIAELQHQLDLTNVVLGTEAATARDQARAVELQKQIDLLGKIGVERTINVNTQAAIGQVREFDTAAHDAFINLAENGSNAFKDIGASLKRYVLDALYKLAIQPFIVQIGAQLTGLPVGTIANALGSTGGGVGGLSNLFPGGTGGLYNSFANSGVGGALGLSGAPIAGTAGGLSLGVEELAGSATLASTGMTAFGTAVGAAIPYVGLFIAGLSLLSSTLFNKKPSPTEGQFQITPGTTGFEDNFSTASPFGNIGFADQGTKQFSGEAAQAFNQIISGALDAFETRYSPEQSDRLAQILQSTAFPHFEGTFSTEDFIKQYGGQILQQVISSAFDVLDPALGAVADKFTGTADEIAKFGNTLLAVYDASKDFDKGFRDNIIGALGDATQATADKVLAFVGVVQTFGDSITGLGAQLESLDPASITAFVDALGGAADFAKTFEFIGANFTTSAQRVAQTQQQLTASFAALHIAVPRTHDDFLALLASFNLTTDAGRQLYASVSALAPAFVAVNGTAEQAAQALIDAANAAAALADRTRSAYASFIAGSFTTGEGDNQVTQSFLTQQEQTTRQIQADWTVIHDIWTKYGDLLMSIGLDHIPTSLPGFRAMIDQIDMLDGQIDQQTVPAFAELFAVLLEASGAVLDLNHNIATLTATTLSASVTSVGGQIDAAHAYVDSITSKIDGLLSNFVGTTGDKLTERLKLLASYYTQAINTTFASSTQKQTVLNSIKQLMSFTAGDLAEYTKLYAQYGSDSIASQLVDLEHWNTQQQQILRGNADALAALKIIVDQKWMAIVNGTADAVESIADLLKRVNDLIGNFGGTTGDTLKLRIALLNSELTKALATVGGSAMADKIRDQIALTSSKLTFYLTQLAATGSDQIASQLLDLQTWYDGLKTALAGNSDGLATLQQIFDRRWQEIIAGTSDGANRFLDALKKIKDYVQSLLVGDISALSPRDRLATAGAQYNADLASAQAGNLDALDRITKDADTYLQLFRDVNASAGYGAFFNTIVGQLTALGTPPPTTTVTAADASVAIVAALPVGGKLVSSADASTNTDKLLDKVDELMDQNAQLTTFVAGVIEKAAATQVKATATAGGVTAAIATMANK